MKTIKVAIITILLSGMKTYAAYPLSTDDAGTVKQSLYELEASYVNYSCENEMKNHSSSISFKHGLTNKMDIGILFPYQIDPVKEERFGEASVSAKFSLIKDVLAATFSNELGEKDYFINVIFTKELSLISCNLNMGYISTGDENEKGRGLYGFSLQYPFDKYEAVGEIQGQEGGCGNCLLGIRRRISESLFIASGISRVFESNTDRVTAGFHLEF
jgi:hypothetical protein